MKQVWQTEDGGIFSTKEEAEKWEADRVLIYKLTSFLFSETHCPSEDAIREIVTALLARYKVEKK